MTRHRQLGNRKIILLDRGRGRKTIDQRGHLAGGKGSGGLGRNGNIAGIHDAVAVRINQQFAAENIKVIVLQLGNIKARINFDIADIFDTEVILAGAGTRCPNDLFARQIKGGDRQDFGGNGVRFHGLKRTETRIEIGGLRLVGDGRSGRGWSSRGGNCRGKTKGRGGKRQEQMTGFRLVIFIGSLKHRCPR